MKRLLIFLLFVVLVVLPAMSEVTLVRVISDTGRCYEGELLSIDDQRISFVDGQDFVEYTLRVDDMRYICYGDIVYYKSDDGMQIYTKQDFDSMYPDFKCGNTTKYVLVKKSTDVASQESSVSSSAYRVITTSSTFGEQFKERIRNNTRFGCGFGGAFTHFQEGTRGSFLFDFTIFGVYIDIAMWTATHKNSVKVQKWYNEPTAFSMHLGYQVPLFKHVRFIPVVGFAKIGSENVDGSNWSVTNSGIVNSSYEVFAKLGFDAGMVVSFISPAKREVLHPCFKFNITATIHQVYASMGIDL